MEPRSREVGITNVANGGVRIRRVGIRGDGIRVVVGRRVGRIRGGDDKSWEKRSKD